MKCGSRKRTQNFWMSKWHVDVQLEFRKLNARFSGVNEMTELLVVNSALADKLLKAGIALVEQGRVVDGNRCFVFQYGPGQSAIVKRIINGR